MFFPISFRNFETLCHKFNFSAFQNYRLESKLLEELGEEIDVIISNTVQSRISPFINPHIHLGRAASTGICYHHCTEIRYCLSFT